jgi:hypothetical protein
MLKDQQPIQELKRDRRNHEQVHRRNAVSVVAKKRLPSLGRRSPPPSHVLGDRRLPNIDAKLEEFAIDPGCPPKRIRDTHLSNELPNLQLCLWPATLRSRFPAPIRAQACAMPADQRLRLDDCQSIQNTAFPRYNPAKTSRSILLRVSFFGDLRRRILSWWRSTRFSASSEARDRNHPTSAYQINLQRLDIGQASPDSQFLTNRFGFAVGTGSKKAFIVSQGRS